MMFFLISSPRTGSTALRSILNKNLDIYLYGEVLFPDFFSWGFFSWLAAREKLGISVSLPSQWSAQFLGFFNSIAENMFSAGKSHVGVDLKWGQVESVYNLNDVLANSGFGVIHLVRKNALATVLSQERMVSSSNLGLPVHVHKGDSKENIVPIKLKISGKWLDLRTREILLIDEKIEQTYGNGKYIKIFYEDVFSKGGAKETARLLSEFFGFSILLDMGADYVKVGVNDLSNFIETDDLGWKIITKYSELENVEVIGT